MDKLEKLPYTKITTEEQYDKYCKKISELIFSDTNGEDKSLAEHIELLSLLIKDWNERQFDGEELDPISLLKSLMDDHGLKQQDIAEICDVNKSFVSEVLNYKKYISKKMIRRIADYFKVRQDALNKIYKLESRVLYVLNTQQMFLETNEPKWYEHTIGDEFSQVHESDLLSQPHDGILNLKIVGDC